MSSPCQCKYLGGWLGRVLRVSSGSFFHHLHHPGSLPLQSDLWEVSCLPEPPDREEQSCASLL